MPTTSRDRRSGLLAAAAVAALLLTGCAQDSSGETGEAATAPASSSSASVPSAHPAPPTETAPSASPAAPSAGPTSGPASTPAGAPAPMAESAPTAVRIPSTGTGSELLHLGLREDGALEVPPEAPGSPAAWYDGSPTPGERGPAVLLGHVNATGGGPGVFAGLRELAPGDTIEVDRADGTTAVFAVERAEQYTKDAFDTRAVYGNTEGPELRLITCDGYDRLTGEFDDNYVVFATLVG
ncbi:class F sortase [Kocuria flava]|uniref:class F sortase n=1 Tax=Kocuria flava TaxID=446860 RepID=UPI002F9266B6